MADELGLLHLPQLSSSLLVRSQSHSSLIARGRKDAASIMVRKSALTSPEAVTVLADQSDAIEQFNLGKMHYYGEGVQQDYTQAAVCFLKAAEQGLPIAQYCLGFLHAKGQGVPQDFAQAAVWYRKAAEQGDARAQLNLGKMYSHGDGVAEDNALAAVWIRKAAEQGLATAQCNLGYRYQYGEGVPYDHQQATYWYRKAAEQGHVEAQASLGWRWLYNKDRGVPWLCGKGQDAPLDYIEAYFWLKVSPPAEWLKRYYDAAATAAAAVLTPTQLSEVEERAAKWLAQHPASTDATLAVAAN
jgi:TPR repeat protein